MWSFERDERKALLLGAPIEAVELLCYFIATFNDGRDHFELFVCIE